MSPWLVLAHEPDRGTRTLFRGPERLARRTYLQRHARLKAGHLLLVSPEGKPVAWQSAIRLNRHV
jgi:hypothetical protein